MNSLCIVAPEDARNNLFRSDFKAHSAASQNSRDSKEISQDKNYENSFPTEKRSQSFHEKLRKRGRFATIPEETWMHRWPGSRYSIFGLIVGRSRTRPISTKELIVMSGLGQSTVRGELAFLVKNGFIVADYLTTRTNHGTRKFAVWTVNSDIIDDEESGYEPFSPIQNEGSEDNGAVDADPTASAESTQARQSFISDDLGTHKEGEIKNKNNKDTRTSEGCSDERPKLVKSDSPNLPIKPRTKGKTKPPRDGSGIAKRDLVGMMRGLYNDFTSTLVIEGCMAHLLKRFDRQTIWEALLQHVEQPNSSDGMKWTRHHSNIWAHECRQVLESREPSLAAHG